MTGQHATPDEVQIDRLRELASIGAGHAAGALARLVGRPCRMQVPSVRPLPAGENAVAEPSAAVLFEVEGGPGGLVALLFPASARDALVLELVGRAPGGLTQEVAESALAEVGNILASHAVSAMADTLGVAMRPSVPVLAMEDGGSVLALRLAQHGLGPRLRLETEISDPTGHVRSQLVFVPDRA